MQLVDDNYSVVSSAATCCLLGTTAQNDEIGASAELELFESVESILLKSVIHFSSRDDIRYMVLTL